MIASTLVLPIERAVINWYDGKSAPIRAVPRRRGTDFMAMGREHPFSFTLAMSLFVDRDCQDELDPLHSKLVESDPSSCHSPSIPSAGIRMGVAPLRRFPATDLMARGPGGVLGCI